MKKRPSFQILVELVIDIPSKEPISEELITNIEKELKNNLDANELRIRLRMPIIEEVRVVYISLVKPLVTWKPINLPIVRKYIATQMAHGINEMELYNFLSLVHVALHEGDD